MSDLDRFIELYKDLGINLVVHDCSDRRHPEAVFGINLSADDGETFEGYWGFFSEIGFDRDGKFVFQGFWE